MWRQTAVPAELWKPLPLRLTTPSLAAVHEEINEDTAVCLQKTSDSPSSMFISSSDMVVIMKGGQLVGEPGSAIVLTGRERSAFS